MAVADSSQVRLADVAESAIGVIPSNPTFQIMRYVTSNVRINKQTDVPNEIRADRNVGSIVDVGRAVSGSIDTLLSYGTFDTWLERLLCSSWATNVLKNGVAAKSGTLEYFFEQGATDTFVRYRGVRFNTLDLSLRARESVKATWGIMGLGSPTPTTAILTGATYTAPTTTEVFNAALNVGSLSFTGITSAPKIRSMNLRINNNIYQNDVVGSYEAYSHGLGRFEVTGSLETYFEDFATYQAILDHSDVNIGFTLTDAANNSYAVSIPKVKLLDGGPEVAGNGRAVMLDVPFQAKYDSSSSASISITRTPGP